MKTWFQSSLSKWVNLCAATPWSKAAEGDGAAVGNFFAQQASFWEGWGASDERGLLIAPDGAGGKGFFTLHGPQ